MKISKGDPIEVCSHEEGFSGAWFAATVIKKHGAAFLVEFRDLMTEDEKSMLREKVDASQIRPTPPLLKSDRFVLHQEVDVYDQDGWWGGVVTEVLENHMYTVYFRESHEEKTYCASQLRAHQDWIYDKWVQASENFQTMGESVQLNSCEQQKRAQIEVQWVEEIKLLHLRFSWLYL